MAVKGSSPLTRGKQIGLPPCELRAGLIPAHAGKTLPRDSLQRGRRAHPRSRGENRSTGGGDKVGAGSSPLTRGKPRPRDVLPLGDGLIPAHAGKTSAVTLATVRPWAHPRSRGENVDGQCLSDTVWGSSPLTRGKQGRGRTSPNPLGLIPAHAGKTRSAGEAGGRPRAHPRSRGENYAQVGMCISCRGSSPLTRGKPCRWPLRHRAKGLIPAHAGKTVVVM